MKCMRENEYYDIMTAGTEEKYAAAENATAIAKASASLTVTPTTSTSSTAATASVSDSVVAQKAVRAEQSGVEEGGGNERREEKIVHNYDDVTMLLCRA